jgi:membrane-associated phospholipid phosphatase
MLLDRLVMGYTGWVALLVFLKREYIPEWPALLAFHALVLLGMAVIPRRGAGWETPPTGEAAGKRWLRGGLRFFRFTFPLLLMVFYFEEVRYTVGALWPQAPYWFEPHLYAADRFLFGDLPSRLLNPSVGIVPNELMHAFYVSYYFIVVGGVVFAWFGLGSRKPGPAFQTTITSVVAAFVLCFVWYPFLPARGPWENPALMATLTPLDGPFFVPLVEAILEQGAVSGGCFPSSHVAASWATVLGLARFHPMLALVLGVLASGLSVACVYGRYHHGVDVPAGLLAAVAGVAIGALGSRNDRRSRESSRDLPRSDSVRGPAS